MTEKNMDLNSPILVRIFKQEAARGLEGSRRPLALLKTYPICRWSGDSAQGARGRPPGAGRILCDLPAQMNPQSSFYLSFNTGYPNAFDSALAALAGS
jgi:murein L,D-transpeptidase YafK